MKKLIAGILLIVLCAAIVTYMVVTISSNIPEAGLHTGPGSIFQFQEPFPGARLVLFLLLIVALYSFISGLVLIAIGWGEMR